MKYDFYFSKSLHEDQMNPFNWIDAYDELMCVIKLNDVYIPYSEKIEHGKTPVLKLRDDLVFLATLDESEVDIKHIKKY